MPSIRQLVKQRKINLITTRRNIPRSVWYIGKRQSGFLYYFADFDDDSLTALWSKHQQDGMTFKTEAGVHQFLSAHLNNRTDIILLQVDV